MTRILNIKIGIPIKIFSIFLRGLRKESYYSSSSELSHCGLRGVMEPLKVFVKFFSNSADGFVKISGH